MIVYPPPRIPTEEQLNNYDAASLLDELTRSESEIGEDLNEQLAEVVERYQLERLMREAEEKARNEQDPILPFILNNNGGGGGSFFTERQRQLEEDANEQLEEMMEAHEPRQQEEVKRKGDDPGAHTWFREVSRVDHIPAVSYYPHQVLEESDWENEKAKAAAAVETGEGALAVVPLPSEEGEPVVNGGGGIYTEGGVVYLGKGGAEEPEESESESREEARSLLANMLGFTRHERLDVKKPGPMIVPPSSSGDEPKTAVNKEVLPATLVDTPKTKKVVIEGHQTEDHGIHSVDAEYAHVKFTTVVDNWRDGERIVQAIGEQLNLASYLTHIRVDQHEVSFRVDTNPEKKTATDVARAINDPRFKSNLSRRLGVNVLYAGIGDKTQASDYMSRKLVNLTQDQGIDSTHLMVYMFVGAGAAAIIVAVITMFVVKRHDKVKSKLGGLQGSGGGGGGVDSGKDYQELCRARMAGGKGTDTATSGRITTLTKENERPPSSRSSTSSWSEEPMTNMDISTGHMVLSYMEDHLRNKNRLQREWEALIAYEAEPNSRDAGLQEQCVKLNRDGAPLPFDHSRVVLNHLSNAEGLDYINASTIVSGLIERFKDQLNDVPFPLQTDHDPRAPAYVAAQGPMQSTVAHFWQMIWEQGTVVIVALCRLQENGDISCTRYWPEEGAETYHIYEVHLVSEHIWCDDYLVRSFYLKNLATGETRTVTQFHFLTWPQMGVPASAKPLLEFRRKVNKSYRGRSCPIVVHSGNGAGRTGAYILLDLVLGRMNKGAREIDIAATLEHLRDQRAGLVETRPQFEFVLMAVAEEVHAILKALPNTTSTEKRDIDKDPIKETEQQPKKADEKKGAVAEEKKAAGGAAAAEGVKEEVKKGKK